LSSEEKAHFRQPSCNLAPYVSVIHHLIRLHAFIWARQTAILLRRY